MANCEAKSSNEVGKLRPREGKSGNGAVYSLQVRWAGSLYLQNQANLSHLPCQAKLWALRVTPVGV